MSKTLIAVVAVLGVAVVACAIYIYILLQDNDAMADELRSVQTDLTSTQAELADTRATLSDTQQTLATTQSDFSATRLTLTSTQEDLESANRTLTLTQSELISTKDDLDRAQQDLDTANADLDEAKSASQDLKDQLSTTQQKLTTARETLLGLGITIYAGNADAAQGSMFHLLNHGLMKGLAFLAAGSLLYALTLSAGAHSPLLIADLSGAGRRYPLVGLALSLALLGLAGLPPLAGFMSKWQIFISGFETHDVWIIALVIFAALNSVFSLAYYTPLINTIYRRKLSAPVQFGAPVPATMTLPLAGLALLILLVGMWPALTYWLTSPAGSALLAAFGN